LELHLLIHKEGVMDSIDQLIDQSIDQSINHQVQTVKEMEKKIYHETPLRAEYFLTEKGWLQNQSLIIWLLFLCNIVQKTCLMGSQGAYRMLYTNNLLSIFQNVFDVMSLIQLVK
jgi:hypothetical protein